MTGSQSYNLPSGKVRPGTAITQRENKVGGTRASISNSLESGLPFGKITKRRRPNIANSQAFHRHLSIRNSDKMSENRAGYNGYFLEGNVSALQKARMPAYTKDDADTAA